MYALTNCKIVLHGSRENIGYKCYVYNAMKRRSNSVTGESFGCRDIPVIKYKKLLYRIQANTCYSVIRERFTKMKRYLQRSGAFHGSEDTKLPLRLGLCSGLLESLHHVYECTSAEKILVTPALSFAANRPPQIAATTYLYTL